ncbi:mercuric reductase [Halobacterium sp. DL1]|jgi:copper chaperone CopZ|nr:mercuric reductase [Halobacterium sp. DL1]
MANSRTTFAVPGLESEGDVEEIEAALREREGVQLAEADAGSGEVTVRYGEELISEVEIKSVVQDLGYEVELTEEDA